MGKLLENMSSEITCRECSQVFLVDDMDADFYARFFVPVPSLCPLCRARRRLAFRNERVFYRRKCDRCGKDGVSMYSPNKPYTVWCYDCWFAEDWDPLTYGRAYNFERSFFDQFGELWSAMPKVGLVHVRSVNSEYLNISADNKDCYMIIESSNNEGCIHCYWIQQCRDSVDVSFAHQTELSYEADDCYNSYRVFYSKGCHDSRESYFLLHCRDVSNCVGCVNLRNKQYCAFNKQLTKEEYERFVTEARFDTFSGVEKIRERFVEFARTQPLRYAEVYNAPGCTGNYIKDAKDCRFCFHSYDAENCRYGVHVWRSAKDCMDVDTAGRNAEHIYNSMNAGLDTSHYICSSLCWSCSFMDYSSYCFNSNYCFGCVGLRKKYYCILNRRYEKAEYEMFREKIIEDMRRRGEWGEFFPSHLSTFGYNESAAFDQFPLSKEEALRLGFKWEDVPRGTFGKETVQWGSFPDSIRDIGGREILKDIFACVSCGKNYRVISREFEFYKRFEIPIPRLCPDCRHTRRFVARGPNRTWERKCDCRGMESGIMNQELGMGKYRNTARHFHGEGACTNTFLTNYSEEQVPVVYCEECYQAEIN